MVTSKWPWASIVQDYSRLRQPTEDSPKLVLCLTACLEKEAPLPDPLGKQEGLCCLKCSEMAQWKGGVYRNCDCRASASLCGSKGVQEKGLFLHSSGLSFPPQTFVPLELWVLNTKISVYSIKL